MSLLRKSPEQIRFTALSCLAIAALLAAVNTALTASYFTKQFGNPTALNYWGGWGLSVMILLFETGLTALLLSPDEIGHIFQAPVIRLPDTIPRWFPSAIKAMLLVGAVIITVWIYSVDWRSTQDELQIDSPEASNFAAFALVFGSEVLSFLFHCLWGLAKIGTANTAPFWRSINRVLEQVQQSDPVKAEPPEQKKPAGTTSSSGGKGSSLSEQLRSRVKKKGG